MTSGLMVKVCGMTRAEDVRICASLGADMLGFIFHPESPRNVDPGFPASVDPGGAAKVGVFVDQDQDEVLRIMDRGRLDLAQLHGGQDPEFCERVGLGRVIKVMWPERYASFEEFERDFKRFSGLCRSFLFDAGASGGGHGRSIKAGKLAGLKVSCPWLLAGGLGPDNVARAVRALGPAGVDMNSGVESAPGVKDHDKLARAFEALAGLRKNNKER